jgi:hypothetical protein
MQIVVIALEHSMRLDVDLHIQVSGRAAVDAGFAFAGKSHAIAFVDARGNPHRKRLLQLHAA